MKQRRVSVIGALVVIVSVVALITGCPQANNQKNNTQNGIVYVGISVEHGETYRFTTLFEANGTFTTSQVVGDIDMVIIKGTYTGDASKDGTITMKITKTLTETGLVDYTGIAETISISGGKFSFNGTQYTRK